MEKQFLLVFFKFLFGFSTMALWSTKVKFTICYGLDQAKMGRDGMRWVLQKWFTFAICDLRSAPLYFVVL